MNPIKDKITKYYQPLYFSIGFGIGVAIRVKANNNIWDPIYRSIIIINNKTP